MPNGMCRNALTLQVIPLKTEPDRMVASEYSVAGEDAEWRRRSTIGKD